MQTETSQETKIYIFYEFCDCVYTHNSCNLIEKVDAKILSILNEIIHIWTVFR